MHVPFLTEATLPAAGADQVTPVKIVLEGAEWKDRGKKDRAAS